MNLAFLAKHAEFGWTFQPTKEMNFVQGFLCCRAVSPTPHTKKKTMKIGRNPSSLPQLLLFSVVGTSRIFVIGIVHQVLSTTPGLTEFTVATTG